MRLFIAINFSDEIKNLMTDAADRLKRLSVKGNFTRRENFHLTVVFIGETSETGKIKTAMDHVRAQKFRLTLNGFGTFGKRRRGGTIYWMGVEKNDPLVSVYRQLNDYLAKAGFALEQRPFSPHLTLGRQVVTKENFDFKEFSENITPAEVFVDKISLMRSERVGGVLMYTEIYSKELD